MNLPFKLADALRLADILDKTPPMPTPAEVYSPERGADWAFMVTTLDAMARMVGPLARVLHGLQRCDQHISPVYYERGDCPACAEVGPDQDDLSAPTPEPRRPQRPVALRHEFRPTPGSLATRSCLHCGVVEGAAATDLCASRLALR